MIQVCAEHRNEKHSTEKHPREEATDTGVRRENAKSEICAKYAPVCAEYALIWKTHNLLRYALGMRLGNLYEKRNSVARVAVFSALYVGGRPYIYIYTYSYIFIYL